MLLLDQAVSTAAFAPAPAPVAPRHALRGRRATLLALVIILLAGCFLRLPSFVFVDRHPTMHWLAPLHPTAKFQVLGFDEGIYRAYVSTLILHGLASYPAMADTYLQKQRSIQTAILPPTRFFYIGAAYTWHLIWGTGPRTSLNVVSSLCSMLLLVLSALFAWRLGGAAMGLCVAALMAFAPTQIHMSQHALIDGVFAFWATLSLWLLWENMQRPNRWLWLAAYAGALAVMVLTKENAMFAYIGILVLIAANHWLRFGRVTKGLCLVTVLGPLLGVVILVFLCGGLGTTIEIYRLFISKVSVLKYAIRTGDGPWYRYLVDLMVVSPAVLVLAIGGIFRLKSSERAGLYLFLFVGASFLVMVNIRYGMNLRYTNMWDFPLRYLAVLCLWQIFPRRNAQALLVGLCLAALCTFELRQYHLFFVENDLYELVPEDLLRAVKMLK
ncbi:MAG TPA: phospholipid carrier-dependent glycosyltransferase [Chthoniobacterales bacterium]|nr:phospholipid carrier-dependent glycosyltransferase [Chthoniobacterales bacterium]